MYSEMFIFMLIFRKWLDLNTKTANERSESLQTIRDDVKKLEKRLQSNLHLAGIEYDCAWNFEHIRGCLKSLDHLFKMHTSEMNCLKGAKINIYRDEIIEFIYCY